MSCEKQARLQQELLEGETIEWSGEPKREAVFSAWDIFMIPFSLMWCGFAIFWEISVITHGVPIIIFPVFGFFFVVIGLYIVFGRFVVKYMHNKNAVYAITNQRILVLGKRSVSARELVDIPLVQKTLRRNGSGSLDFEPSSRKLFGWNTDAMYDFWGFGQKNRMKFTNIDNVHEVYRLVYEQLQAAKKLQ